MEICNGDCVSVTIANSIFPGNLDLGSAATAAVDLVGFTELQEAESRCFRWISCRDLIIILLFLLGEQTCPCIFGTFGEFMIPAGLSVINNLEVENKEKMLC